MITEIGSSAINMQLIASYDHYLRWCHVTLPCSEGSIRNLTGDETEFYTKPFEVFEVTAASAILQRLLANTGLTCYLEEDLIDSKAYPLS